MKNLIILTANDSFDGESLYKGHDQATANDFVGGKTVGEAIAAFNAAAEADFTEVLELPGEAGDNLVFDAINEEFIGYLA